MSENLTEKCARRRRVEEEKYAKTPGTNVTTFHRGGSLGGEDGGRIEKKGVTEDRQGEL